MTQNKIFICPAQIVDVPEIHNIIQIIQENMTDKSLFIADDTEFIGQHINKQGFILTARDEKNRIFAFCIVRFPKLGNDNLGKHLQLENSALCSCAHIESIGVLPSTRGFSLQKKLMEQAEIRLKMKRYSHVFATVSPENQVSLKNFLEKGYQIIETAEKYGGYIRHILHKKI